MSTYHNIQTEPAQEQQVKKEWDIFYYEDRRYAVFIEKDKEISLLSSQDKADLEWRWKQIYDITSAWASSKSDLTMADKQRLAAMPEEEFKDLWRTVQLWDWNVHHQFLYPLLSEVIKTNQRPGETELSQQKYWKKLIDPQKLKALCEVDVDRVIEIQNKLDTMIEQEEAYARQKNQKI